MNATVFVEKVGRKKYRATTSQSVPLETEGASQDEALERLYELAKKRLAAGQLFQMRLPGASATNPPCATDGHSPLRGYSAPSPA